MKHVFVSLDSQFIHQNLALALLASISEEEGYETFFQEFTVNQPRLEILRNLEAADAYFFSAYVWNSRMILDLIGELKKVTDAKIYVGGPQASADPEPFLTSGADLVCIGEGETPLEALLRGEDHAAWYDGTKEKYWNRERELDRAYPFERTSPDRIVYYETQRGCPYRCSYCQSATQQGISYRDLDLVETDLKHLIGLGVHLIKFVDRSFNLNTERTLKLLDIFRRVDDNKVTFHLEISPHALSDGEVEAMNSLREGLLQLEIGIQSLDPRVLKAIDRPLYTSDMLDRVKALRPHKHLDLIAGLPYFTYDLVHQSFQGLKELGADEIQLGFLKVLPETPISQKAVEFALVSSEVPPFEVLSTKWMNFDEWKKLKDIDSVMSWFNRSEFPLFFRVFPGDLFTLYESLSELAPLKQRSIETRLQAVAERIDLVGLRELIELDYRRKRNRHKGLFFNSMISERELLGLYEKGFPEDVTIQRQELFRTFSALRLCLDRNLTVTESLHTILIDHTKAELYWLD